MLLPLTGDHLPFLSALALELGGLWTRPALHSSIPPQPLDVAVRQGVLAQALVAIPGSPVGDNVWVHYPDVLGEVPACGVVGIVDPNPRARTAWLDLGRQGLIRCLGCASSV